MTNADRDDRIGRFAVERGYLTPQQLERAIAERDEGESGLRLGRLLVRLGYLTEGRFSALLREEQLERVRAALSGYEVLEHLGEGSMGIVYKARQRSLDRLVAIKVLAPRFARQKGYVEWFLREAKTVARLNHPNIVTGIDSGEAQGHHYFVMEYVDGPTLAELVERGGPVDEARALEITQQISQALDYAHRHHFLHRDIKPQNVIIAPGGIAKLCDLGLARSPRSESTERASGIYGTPYYVSPEQVRGEDRIDIRSDIYSLGLTLWTMLTGRLPFEGGSRAEIMAARLARDLPDPAQERPELMDGTRSLVRRMTARDRRQRFATPSDLLDELRLGLSELTLREAPVRRSAPAPRRRSSKPRRRR